MKIKKNKSNLISFLVADWCKRIPSKLACGKSLVLGYEEGIAVEIKSDGYSDIQGLTCDYEDADSRIFVHCLFAVTRQECSQVVVRSPDTDVAMLCLYNYEELSCDQLWFHTRTGKRQRFIPMLSIVHSLGPDVCKLLPPFHAITGCDSTSALYGHSKNMLSHY